MVCSSCGSSNPETNRFCGQCGARLTPAAPSIEDAGTLGVSGTPVSSAFRAEVERQQYQLRHLQHQERPAESKPRDAQPREADVRGAAGHRSGAFGETETFAAGEPSEPTSWESTPNNFGEETIVSDPPPGGSYSLSHTPFAQETQVIDARPGNKTTSEENSYEEPPISGPSFLGLGEPERDSKTNLAYLYEDDSGPSRARYWVAALLVIACIAFVAYEWKQNWNWDTTIIGRHRAQQADAGKPGGETAPDKTHNTGATQNNPAFEDKSNGTPTQAAGSPAPATQDNSASETGSSPANSGSSAAAQANPPSQDALHNDTAGASGKKSNADQSSTTARNESNEAGQQSSAARNESGSDDEAQNADAEATSATPARRAKRSPAKPVASRYAENEPDSDLVAKADAYLYGRSVPKNCAQALVYLRTAANRGNAEARSKLGGLYATGHCVSLDRAEAYNWFTLAREAGSKNIWVERNRQMLWSQMTQDEKARTLGP